MADNSLGAKVGVPVVVPVLGDWVTYTPILSTSTNAATNLARYRLVGTMLEIRLAISWTGTGGATPLTVSIPSGFTIDTASTGTDLVATSLGYGYQYVASGTTRHAVATRYASTTTVAFARATGTSFAFNGSDFTTNDQLNVDIRVPIVGSANVAYGAGLATSTKSGLLKSYEEGTFTPTFTATGGGAVTTYSLQTGEYTKVGNIVHFSLRVSSATFSASGTGSAQVSGLPFTAFNSNYKAATVGFAAGWVTNQNPLSAIIGATGTIMDLLYRTGNSTPTIAVPVAAFSSGCDIIISGTYRTAT